MKPNKDIGAIVMNKKLTLDSKIENISIIEKTIDEISSEYGLSSELYGNVLVSVIEVSTNAILHGNKLDAKKKVTVDIAIENNVLEFTVQDEGPGFDFTNVPDPTLPENIEKPHGRGIFLMNNLADEVSFKNNGSTTTLKFNLK